MKVKVVLIAEMSFKDGNIYDIGELVQRRLDYFRERTLPQVVFNITISRAQKADAGEITEACLVALREDSVFLPPFPVEDGDIPLCAKAMGCLCWAHASGRAAEGPCDTREDCDPDV